MNEKIEKFTKDQLKAEPFQFEIGSTVKVHVRIKEGSRERIQVFEGVVIAKKHGGVNETVTVRRISYGVGAVSYTHLDVYKRKEQPDMRAQN